MKDLDRKSALTTDEALEIAEQMQRIALGALYRSGPLEPENSVFHGGGAIRLAWSSDRLSEDLDFLIDSSLEKDLERGVEAARVEIEQRMNTVTPGCTVSLTRKPVQHYELVESTESYTTTLLGMSELISTSFWATSVGLYFTDIGPSGDVVVVLCATSSGLPHIQNTL